MLKAFSIPFNLLAALNQNPEIPQVQQETQGGALQTMDMWSTTVASSDHDQDVVEEEEEIEHDDDDNNDEDDDDFEIGTVGAKGPISVTSRIILRSLTSAMEELELNAHNASLRLEHANMYLYIVKEQAIHDFFPYHRVVEVEDGQEEATVEKLLGELAQEVALLTASLWCS